MGPNQITKKSIFGPFGASDQHFPDPRLGRNRNGEKMKETDNYLEQLNKKTDHTFRYKHKHDSTFYIL